MTENYIKSVWPELNTGAMSSVANWFFAARRILIESGLSYSAQDVIALSGQMQKDFESSVRGATGLEFCATVADILKRYTENL